MDKLKGIGKLFKEKGRGQIEQRVPGVISVCLANLCVCFGLEGGRVGRSIDREIQTERYKKG